MLSGEYMSNEHIPQLSDLEKKTFCALAEDGPTCGYDFHLGGQKERYSVQLGKKRKAKMSSGSWWDIYNHLGPQGENLITVVRLRNKSSEDERGRRKDLVWLTPEGVIFALTNLDVDLSKLLDNVKRVYPNNPEYALPVELSRAVGKDVTRASYLLKTGQYDKVDRAAFLSLLSKGKKEGFNHMRRLNQLLRNYDPEYQKSLKKNMKDMRNTLGQVIDLFEETAEPKEEEKKE